jgi:hypothetical protein
MSDHEVNRLIIYPHDKKLCPTSTQFRYHRKHQVP